MSITTETKRQREILQAVIDWGTRPSTRWLVVEGESGYSAQLDDYTRVQVWRSAVLVGPYNIHVPPEENTLYEHASKDWHVRLLATLQSSDDDAVQEISREPRVDPRALGQAHTSSIRTRPAHRLMADEDVRPAFPVALERLHVKNFHCIRDTRIEPLPANTPWIFLTGENGSGKTDVLRAIAVGLNGPNDGKTILADSSSQIYIQYHYQGRSIQQELHAGDFFAQRKFAAYGPSRLQSQARESQATMEQKSSPTYSLFNDDGILLNVENWLHDFYFADPDLFEELKQRLLEILPYLADIEVKRDEFEQRSHILYTERDPDTGDTFEPVEWTRLARGTRSHLAMVGDMWMRLSRQHRGELDPARLSGIVLIDELDNHLHPKWQRNLPSLLSRVFPRVQFIASTHSVIPCLGAPRGSVFLKVSRTRGASTVVERLHLDIGNLLPNSILTSPLFDLDQLIPESNTSLHALHTEDFYQDIEERQEVRAALEQLEIRESSGGDAVQEIPAPTPRSERLRDLLLEILYFDALQHGDPNLMDEWQQRVWCWFALQNRRTAAANEFRALFDWRHDQKLAQRVPPTLRERLLPDCLRAHPVTVLGLAESDPRTHNALVNGCSTVEDVVCLSDEQLLRLPRMGETRLARVREAQERVVAEILGTA